MAADMASAIKRAAEADLDLIISDIELPDGSGIELLWRIRAARNIPAIALSGFGSSDDIEQSQSAGFAIHLTKPVDFRTLERCDRADSPRRQLRLAIRSLTRRYGGFSSWRIATEAGIRSTPAES